MGYTGTPYCPTLDRIFGFKGVALNWAGGDGLGGLAAMELLRGCAARALVLSWNGFGTVRVRGAWGKVGALYVDMHRLCRCEGQQGYVQATWLTSEVLEVLGVLEFRVGVRAWSMDHTCPLAAAAGGTASSTGPGRIRRLARLSDRSPNSLGTVTRGFDPG